MYSRLKILIANICDSSLMKMLTHSVYFEIKHQNGQYCKTVECVCDIWPEKFHWLQNFCKTLHCKTK